MNANSDRIDVLAVMQIASDTCAAVARREGTAADLREARAAVAELIEACNEYGPALAKAEAAAQRYGEESNCKAMREARGAAIRAAKRYRAALARVQP